HQQEASDERPNNTADQVAHDAASAADDQMGEPPGHEPDQQRNDDVSCIHFEPPQVKEDMDQPHPPIKGPPAGAGHGGTDPDLPSFDTSFMRREPSMTISRNMPTVGLVSLGCPKALVDSERILTQLRAEGYRIASGYEGADVVIVNTCGF